MENVGKSNIISYCNSPLQSKKQKRKDFTLQNDMLHNKIQNAMKIENAGSSQPICSKYMSMKWEKGFLFRQRFPFGWLLQIGKCVAQKRLVLDSYVGRSPARKSERKKKEKADYVEKQLNDWDGRKKRGEKDVLLFSRGKNTSDSAESVTRPYLFPVFTAKVEP